MTLKYFIICLFLSLTLSAQESKTSDEASDAEKKRQEELNKKWEAMSKKTTINVIGESKDEMKKIPGSASLINKKTLEQTQPIDAMEALRSVPGASVRYIDGVGLTPNIGFRGVSNEESRKTLILEDGVLTSLSPYGQPESYYIPQIDRMERVEIIKGSGSILYGPSTIGGIVNFVTRRPPRESTLSTKIIGGENGYFSNFTQYGGTFGQTGVDISYLHKSGDGFRDHSQFYLNEINAKLIHSFNESHTISLSLGAHEQQAEATYLGLTQGLFWQDPSINPAEFDRKEVNRNSGVLGHEFTISPKFKLITKVYATHADRNWQRQEFAYNTLNSFGIATTAPSDTYATYAPAPIWNSPGDIIYMRRNAPKRDQGFNTLGIESRASIQFEVFSFKNDMDVGARAHGEQNKVNFKDPYFQLPFVRKGIPFSQQDRIARAYALYLQDSISLTSKLKIIPGVRYENITQGVYSKRRRATTEDVAFRRASAVNDIIFVDQGGETHTKVVLGGFGITYDLTKKFYWFGGIHQGFSPPTYGTAISPTGQDYRLDEETSVNYETGLRGKISKSLFMEIAGYIIYFNNQIINANEIGGDVGTRPVNSGRSIHRGVENTLTFDFGKFFNLISWRIPLNLVYSYTSAKSNSFEQIPYTTLQDGTIQLVQREPYIIDYKGDIILTNTNGNYLPYVPKHTGSASLTFRNRAGYYIRGEYQYIDKQYSDLLNTRNETRDGITGILPAYDLVNASIGYKHPEQKWSVFINGKNLQNRKYVSGRLPIGIHPGPFRQVNFGASFVY
ncbi:MAG: TonB-dependent receptor [Spirochaetota bacterium]